MKFGRILVVFERVMVEVEVEDLVAVGAKPVKKPMMKQREKWRMAFLQR